MANNTKQSIKRVSIMFIIMFLCCALYIIKIVCIDRDKIMVNSYNPRLNFDNKTIKRGDIKDIDGYVLAYSEYHDGEYIRKYNNAETSCHVVGYTGAGKYGIESSKNFILQNISNEVFQRLKNIIKNSEIECDNLYLTIDKDLQDIASNLIKNNKGAVVVEEVSTGRILCMLSKPQFNPQNIYEEWENIKDDENSPLLNRAINGLYTPGSVFKIVTSVAAIRNGMTDFNFNCEGESSFYNKIIHCFKNKSHGEEDIIKAFANSCNVYFSNAAVKMGAEALIKTSNDMLFNTNINFDLDISPSLVQLEASSSESELVETSIGQGKTLVTPVFMACITQAIANNGVMMKPYIVDHIENYSDVTIKTTVPEVYANILTKDECNKLKEMMIETVNSGTGSNANSEYFQVAGKTGTAENPAGNDHIWFIGFAPADNPQYAVSVVIENGDGNVNAAVVARKMLYNAINRNNL